MQAIITSFQAFLDSPALLPAVLAIACAGLVRGFAGFGGAMLFMPFGSFLFDPRLVVIAFFWIDSLLTMPLLVKAVRHWDWRTVVPCIAGSWCGVWFGARLLAVSDPTSLRWAICGIIIVLVLLLASGWRYKQRPQSAISVAVGSLSGVLGGVSQVAAPPLVAYWASGPYAAETIRANLITFFCFSSLGSFVAFFSNGLFTPESTALALWFAPAYALAIFAGARLFSSASETLFRRVAFGMILLSAVTSLPLLDPLLRG